MVRFQRLMVWVERSKDDALLRYAAMICRLGMVKEVHFVQVLPAVSEMGHDQALQNLRVGVKAAFQSVASSLQVDCEVLQGPLLDQLLTHVTEKQIDLLVVGVCQDANDRRIVARRLAMKAPCSVWLVPDGAPSRIDKLLIPVDFSPPSADSLTVATGMAKLSGHSECFALHVYFNEAVVSYEGYDQILRGEEAQAYQQFAMPLNLHEQKVTPIFEESANVAHAIGRVVQTQEIDLIVMATRGRSRSAAILLGSVTEEMIIEANVPLLAVKHFGARMTVLNALLDRRFWHQGNLHT